ncbi:MAG: TIR domain-containing protein, partial [Singulisphaera sp.]|nr:TIR domain-containing protein [Singulisphaera sp.]
MSSLGPKRYDAFLSYNSQDRPAVREVAERLEGEGLELYLEEWELAPGREFQPALAEGLRDSKTCVVFLGPNGLGPWQKQELQVAIDRRARDEAFHVIPVLLPGAERPRRGDVAHLEFLINASWVEFLKTLDNERAFQSLVWGITGTKPPKPDKRYDGVCPYRGLEAFRPDDAKFFFGRANLTGWLVSALRREVRAAHGVRFLGVLGPSGSGKSSVVLAGLVPRLRAGAIEGSERWPVAILRPGDDPLKNLAA